MKSPFHSGYFFDYVGKPVVAVLSADRSPSLFLSSSEAQLLHGVLGKKQSSRKAARNLSKEKEAPCRSPAPPGVSWEAVGILGQSLELSIF